MLFDVTSRMNRYQMLVNYLNKVMQAKKGSQREGAQSWTRQAANPRLRLYTYHKRLDLY